MTRDALQKMWTETLEGDGEVKEEVTKAGGMLGGLDIYPPRMPWWYLDGVPDEVDAKTAQS